MKRGTKIITYTTRDKWVPGEEQSRGHGLGWKLGITQLEVGVGQDGRKGGEVGSPQGRFGFK